MGPGCGWGLGFEGGFFAAFGVSCEVAGVGAACGLHVDTDRGEDAAGRGVGLVEGADAGVEGFGLDAFGVVGPDARCSGDGFAQGWECEAEADEVPLFPAWGGHEGLPEAVAGRLRARWIL